MTGPRPRLNRRRPVPVISPMSRVNHNLGQTNGIAIACFSRCHKVGSAQGRDGAATGPFVLPNAIPRRPALPSSDNFSKTHIFVILHY